MARRKRQAGTHRVPDEELIAKLQEKDEHVLNAQISEQFFDKVVGELLKETALPDDVPHFYCRKCGEYHLKTHPHRNMNSST
jgi:hypothetical protein